jgi:hypothetical protein
MGVIVPHRTTAGGLLIVVALAWGLSFAFGVVVEQLTTNGTTRGAPAAAKTAPIRLAAEPYSWRDRIPSLTLPHVVDRWFDEPTEVDTLPGEQSFSTEVRLLKADRRAPAE